MALELHGRTASELDVLFHAAPIGMGRVDPSGRLTAWNAEFARLAGVPGQDVLHRALAEVSPSIHGLWREIVDSSNDCLGSGRRTVTVGVPPDLRSLEVVGWVSAETGREPFVVLLVDEVSAKGGTPSLAGGIERARFAREIHDGLAQDLWLAKLAASALARHPTLDADGRALCTELLRSIDSGLAEARTAVMAMRSANEPTVTLSELIGRQVDEFSDRFGIRVACHLQDGLSIPAGVSFEMLRVVQEALNNVRKHASAHRVTVRVAQRRASVVLSVHDDGIGFDSTIATTGYGRQSMSERAASIGAGLTVTSVPGHGTTVTLRVPLAESVEQR